MRTSQPDYIELGSLALGREDYQEAVNIFRRSLEGAGTARGYLGLGRAYLGLEDRAAARWAAHKALGLEPGNTGALDILNSLERMVRPSPAQSREVRFRTGSGIIEQLGLDWKPFFIKGVNLGLGLPGHFPGEFAVGTSTYLKWFKQIADMGANALRVYTLLAPGFYEALHRFNIESPKLYLIQGVWVELPPGDDFGNEEYVSDVKSSIRDAVDAVLGNAELPERPGRAHGTYDHDISHLTIGFMFGREWESCAVKHFNERSGRVQSSHNGKFIAVKNATPFGAWAAGMCDYVQSYEHGKYGISHPVSIINWPTLDPFSHPSESDHELELMRQGIRKRKDTCDENEDAESLDTQRFMSRGGGGFYSTYHAYPYYPDFMVNDFLESENTYAAYLEAIRLYHGTQPIVVAEFGVPSARDISHWHRDGWHQGGHNEAMQGEINAVLMRTIHEAGLAGGVVFHWFDEWYKRNWVFLPYELPPERNRLWFNSQDAEQNYGFVAMHPGYPGPAVSLSGDNKEWSRAAVLYEKDAGTLAYRFEDGHDASRELRALSAQHDEGFLYLMVETTGEVDFENTHYIIGLDTVRPDKGEFQLPFGIDFRSPVGFEFAVHLAGIGKSRILVSSSYDRYLNYFGDAVKTHMSDQGAWVPMYNKTNARRISKDGTRFYPSRLFSMSNMRFGSLKAGDSDYDSLADFSVNGNIIELRIPWGLINFTDPSSKTVLWKDGDSETARSDGIRLAVVSYKPEASSFRALPAGREGNFADRLPRRMYMPEDVETYKWDGWYTPVYHTYLKQSYFRFGEALNTIPEVPWAA